MKPKKQPNGKYKLRIYDYTDENGKQHLKQFTAWSKQECIDMAEEYKKSKESNTTYDPNMLFKDACELYISSRTNILSPSSLKKYRYMQRNFEFLDDFKLKDIGNVVLQNYINSIADKFSFKSVKDRYTFLISILASYRPSAKFKVSLPRKLKREFYTPENDEVLRCIESATDPAFKLAICLGAYGMMRAGEISAFRKQDLDENNVLHIHLNMVRGEHGYVVKDPKTYESDRYKALPNFVADMIRNMPEDTIGINPNAITNRWARLLKKLNIPYFRFHDLRAYCCTTYHEMGIPDAIIQNEGGWSSPEVMQRFYRRAKQSAIARQTADINAYFEKLNSEYEDEDE